MRYLAILFFLITSISMQAQRFAYVDSKYILESMPEYAEAQAELDELSEQWQKTIEAKYAEIEKLYKAYQAEAILLTDEMKRKREEEIVQKEKDARDYQKKKFGVEGELFKRRQELIKPLQDRIYDAIKELADDRSYAAIFDKANNATILYSDPKYDKSETILKKLGISTSDK
jgi:outer membrane protein